MEQLENQAPFGEYAKWQGLPQKLFTVLDGHHPEDLNNLRPGWVLSILHDRTQAFPASVKENLAVMLERVPGFYPSKGGLYHYAFIEQLDFICEAIRRGRASGCIVQ